MSTKEKVAKLSGTETKYVSALVNEFSRQRETLEIVLNSLRGNLAGSSDLQRYVHSMKWRIKDPEHLRDKIVRKWKEAKVERIEFDLTVENLFVRINDLVGFRVLHLYTEQLRQIDPALKRIFADAPYTLIEGPVAKTWDDESRAFFKAVGIRTEDSPLYTSVHYVVKTPSRTPYTCEIQVRTLMEEVWGEVDHKINYPHKTTHLSCREQLAALARVTSGCTRLVDSIFRTHVDLESAKAQNTQVKKKKKK